MRLRIHRSVKLLSYLFKNLTLADFIGTIKATLFKDDLIYVFAIDTETIAEDVVETAASHSERNNKVIIKKGEIEELEDFCKRTGQNAWEFNCNKFDGVKDFFIARDVDTIQSVTWIYKRSDQNRFVILGNKDALLQYGLTLSEFRGKGLYPAVQKAAVQYLREQGYQKVLVLVDSHNKASQNSQAKAGFCKIGEVRFRKVFGLQISNKIDVSTI